MARTIRLNFELSVLNVRIGNIGTPRIAAGDGNTFGGWMPYGTWEWNMMGWRPPIPEYWMKPRTGGWSWQIDNPSQTHILLSHDGKVIGAIANFRRQDFEKGNHRMQGDWIIEYDDWKTGGRWQLVSISYE